MASNQTNSPPKPPAMQPMALSVNEAAKTLGVSRATLYREIQDGRLRKRQVRGRTLIAVEDARAWLDAAKVRANG